MSIISWLTAFIGFLNSNNGIITALATALLAYITWRYVRLMKIYVQLTQENVQLTQEIVESSYRPEVVICLLYKDTTNVRIGPTEYRGASMLILSLKNLGPGVARKVKFEGDLSFSPYEDRFPISSVSFLKNGIDRLVPGEERRSDQYFIADPSGDPNQLQVTITGTWEDLKGKEYCEDFRLNFADAELPPA